MLITSSQATLRLGQIHHTLGHFQATTNDADKGQVQDLRRF
jgi:hypothetical protein